MSRQPDPNASIPAATEGPVEIAVVGCGAIAQVVHLPILAQIEGVKLAAICDPDIAKSETVADRLGIPTVHESIDPLLDDDDVRAVVICTPNHLHAPYTERALRAGKDVLCERPLGVNAEETRRVIETARETGRRLLVAHNHRYRPDVLALRELLSRGELGTIYHAHVSWRRRRTRRPRSDDWRRDPERAGGGVLIDVGIEMLDLGLWLIDYPAPKRVTAHTRRLGSGAAEDVAVALASLEETTLSLEVTWGLTARDDARSVYILGTRGSLSLSPFRVEKELDGRVLDATPKMDPGIENVFTASYRRELDHFVSVLRRTEPRDPPEEQITLMRIVDACYRSAEEGREIAL